MTKGPIRVLHLLSALKTGGINSLLLQNVEHMDGEKLEHHVCAVGRVEEHWAREYRDRGVEPFSLGHAGKGALPRTLWRLASTIRSRSIDVVHAHFPFVGAYGAVAAAALGVPLVFSVHSDRSFSRSQRTKDKIFDKTSSLLSSKIIAVSKSVAQSFVEQRGASRSKIEIIYNGVDVSHFKSACSREEMQEVKAQLRIPPAAPVVLNVGRLSSVKSQDMLIPMMGHLLNDVPRAVLLVAGEGPMMPKLKVHVRQEGLHNHVRLLGVRQDVPVLMNLANVFVLPSASEGFSITLLEAMASGLPAVASDIPPNREALPNSSVGKLAPAGDASAFAEEVALVLQSRELAEELSKNGLSRVQAKFDIRRTAERTEALYNRLQSARR